MPTNLALDIIDALDRAWADGAPFAAAVQPDQLANPTACAGWDVRALLDHTLGESLMFSAVNRGEPASSVHGDVHGDLVGDGTTLAAAWDRIGRDNVDSWRDGGLEGDRTYFFGTFPAPVSAIVNLGEVVVHTWDLATATGRAVVLDPELVEVVLGLYAAIPMDEMRANGVFGPEVVVAAAAPVSDRLLGLLGRQS